MRSTPRFGGPQALAQARAELADRGIGLILDYVPNHVAPDHPVDDGAPGLLRPRDRGGARGSPGAFVRTSAGVLANGKDPYFAPWPDVVQLNAFSAGLRDGGDRDAAVDRSAVRRRPLRHGDADDQRGLRPYVGRAGGPAAGCGLLADDHLRGQADPSRPGVHRRGLLGHGVDPAAAGFRLLLRQAPL